MGEFEPQIVGFFCNWCSRTAGDLSGTSQTEYPPNVRVIRVMCSGRINERFILEAFIAGADGILICGCQPGDCHYQKGNLLARRRVLEIKPLLKALGIGSERLRLEWISTSDRAKIERTVEEFTQAVERLGLNPLNGRGRRQ